MVVLVTGANGQLGQSLQQIAGLFPEIEFLWMGSKELDVTDEMRVAEVFQQFRPDYCINTAAFTAVDLAEKEAEKAFAINEKGVKNLALACLKFKVIMLHVSTDFVFDGTKNSPYQEEDVCNPINIYGKSKCAGEQVLREILASHYIIRTSWVFSAYGNNFLKTMLRLGSQKDSISVVNDQIGRPTSAVALAHVLIQMILKTHSQKVQNVFGTYHFANTESCSWFEFAQQIMQIFEKSCEVKSIPSASYPTPATRPKYSVLKTDKIEQTFQIKIQSWQEILKQMSS